MSIEASQRSPALLVGEAVGPEAPNPEQESARTPRVGAILRKGTLALFDQGIVSVTNLLTTIIVGRACGLEDFGLYTLAITVVIFAACAQEALISSPFALYGNRLQGEDRRGFAGSLLVQFGLVALLAAGGLLLVSAGLFAGFGPAGLAPLVALLAAVVPWVLLREFARRMAIARMHLGTALAIDGTVSVLQLGGLAILWSRGGLTPVTALATLAAVAAITGLAWLVLARRQFAIRPAQVAADWSQSWSFGRWILAGQMLALANGYVLHWLLAVRLGPLATGGLALCMSVAQLTNPFVLGIGNLLTPRAAQAYAVGGVPELRRIVAFAGLILGGGLLLFCGLALLFGGAAVHLLYGKYEADFAILVPLLALAQFASAISLAPANGLGAMERSDLNFWSSLIGLTITLILSAALVGPFGVIGATVGLIIGSWSGLAVCWLTFRYLTRSALRAEGQP